MGTAAEAGGLILDARVNIGPYAGLCASLHANVNAFETASRNSLLPICYIFEAGVFQRINHYARGSLRCGGQGSAGWPLARAGMGASGCCRQE